MKRFISVLLAITIVLGYAPRALIHNAYATTNNDDVFCNGTDFFIAENGTEYFINADDEDKLYQKSSDGVVELALDEHIILLVHNSEMAYLIAFRDKECKLILFDTCNGSALDLYTFPDAVCSIALQNNELLYALDGAAYSLNLTSLNQSVIKESGVDAIYFDDSNSLSTISTSVHDCISPTVFNESPNTENSIRGVSNYSPRLTAPATDDPYYTTWNVFYNSGYGMAPNIGNCTCYAFGRSYENLGSEPNLCHNNAGDWYAYNKNRGYYSYGSSPVLGAVAVWKSGGAGHVAVVEVINGDSVITSESGWKSFYFKTVTRSASHSNFSASSYYSFQGFIYVLGSSVDIGTHDHNQGEYMFYEAVHPHYSCYRCSLCGEIWRDYSEKNYIDSCEECINHTHDQGEYMFYEAVHPHYSCYMCSLCGEIWRDYSEMNFISSCQECNAKISFDPQGGSFASTCTSMDFDYINGGRGAGEMVVFTGDGETVNTNMYGYEVSVDSNGLVIDKRLYGDDEKHLTIPIGGFVLSAHLNESGNEKASFVAAINVSEYAAYDPFAMKAYHYKDYDEYLAQQKHVPVNSNYGNLPVPTKEGYYFNGWLTEDSSFADYNTPFSSSSLSASWATDDTAPSAQKVHENHLYERYEYPLSWKEAKAFCEERGGHLVTITSAGEQSAIEDLISTGRKMIYFIGCSDELEEGTWVWVTGEPFSTYNNWDPQYPEPDTAIGFNFGGIVNLPVGVNKQFGEWLSNYNIPNDLSYNYRLCNYGFVCEYEFNCRRQYDSTVIPPTCTAQGYTLHTCSICGYSYNDSYTNALGHSYSFSATTAPTTSSTGVLTGTCSRCNGTTTVTLPKLTTTDYNYSVIQAATCTANGTGRYTWKTTTYGTFCFDVTIPKIGHSYTYAVTTAPTTSTTGVLTGTCSRCNGKTTITLPKLTTTDYNYSVVQASTCTANGTGRYTWKTTTYGTFSFDVTIPMIGHNYVDTVTTPTCTEGGFTTHTCSVCGYSFIDSETSALGHSFGAWTQTKAPTCTEPGQISRTCTRCNTTENIDVAALGHTAGEANQENYIAPTCLDEGGYEAVSRCIRCSLEMSRVHITIPAIGHDWENPAYTWADDNSTVTASRICRHNNTHIETETVTTTTDITIEPTFYSQGEMIVTAVFEAPYFETQTKVVVIPCIENPFEDVPQNAYYYDAVIWAVHHDPQITVGTSSTEFSPNKACTRAQIVTFLWRAAGSPTPEIDEVPFTDVAPTAYFYDAVRWAYEQNITSGTSESSFSPNRACSRSEAVTFLWRTVGSPTATQATTGFIDVSDDIWFSEAVRWAVENSVTVGTSESTFSPNRTCTRAQIVTFLFRVFGESN